MSNKKRITISAAKFHEGSGEIREFLEEAVTARLSKKSMTLAYDTAIIKLYVAFESLMLDCLVIAVNRDPSTLIEETGIDFPQHMNQRMCEYIVTGGGYFDFHGKGDLIRRMQKVMPEDAAPLTIVRKPKYHHPLELLLKLRHLAAHESPQSRKAAHGAINAYMRNQENYEARPYIHQRAGTWLKVKGRFSMIADRLNELATELAAGGLVGHGRLRDGAQSWLGRPGVS